MIRGRGARWAPRHENLAGLGDGRGLAAASARGFTQLVPPDGQSPVLSP
jgi:hypothetical protein